ncbi:MAG TPA: winged helix-turn-helix transcriptional regulator [Tepidimicrobium sp.]|nr:winged helix-turn-helix transcriptional regulator [Tepidimicrobium sp.]
MDLVQVMKALADETRLRILNILVEGALCVCEIEEILGISQSNASRHLNRLTNVKILESYKVGNYVYHKFSQEGIQEYPFIKEIVEDHTMKHDLYKKDYERLNKYRESGFSCDELKDGQVF